ncbi:MAG TPA: IS3 family transposase [Chitinophagaceae bacterium]|nr:IS3 family transposase [Chitinophagaceae bacterium]
MQKRPQSHYQYQRRSLENKVFKEVVINTSTHLRSIHPGYGLRKLHYSLKQLDIPIGRDRLRQLLKDKGLLFKPKPRYFVKTTQSRHQYRLYPNLVKGCVIDRPEQVWVADITAIKVNRRPYFLALVVDAYSRRIMGWELADKNTGSLTCKALLKALSQRKYPHQKIIHHSDRGTQYCCDQYRMLLKEADFTVSTTESGNPRENAIAERTIKTLKYEYGLKEMFKNRKTVLRTIRDATFAYNYFRIHYSCEMLTPSTKHNSFTPPFFV